MKVSEALEIVGGLSEPTKMPGYCYSLPAKECKTGSKLRQIPGSVCSGCYALKGRYYIGHVQKALYRRLDALKHPRWIEAMSFLINHYADTKEYYWFRWHDSGDIQSIQHLHNIVEVVNNTPRVLHWMPTKETKMVELAVKKGFVIPKNLIIRHSAHMIGDKLVKERRGFASTVNYYRKYNTSSVDCNYGFQCPVSSGEETCDTYNCRACWDKSIININYRKH